MTMFHKGSTPPPPFFPSADVQQYTLGKILATDRVAPCSVQGEACDGVFADTIEAVTNGTGVGLWSQVHSGGVAVPVLAAGIVQPGHELVVGIGSDDHPKVMDVDDADDGDIIIGRAMFNSSALAEDLDLTAPSIAALIYPPSAQRKKGTGAAPIVITLHIDLAAIQGNGDVATNWTPGFAGRIVSDSFVATEAATTPAKAATFNLEINGTNVTGGEIALTSANVTPVGNVVAGTPITANNVFDANDTISVEASGVTAFAEGEGDLLMVVSATTTP